jgi:membrane protease YdiL (CAAX protease family)
MAVRFFHTDIGMSLAALSQLWVIYGLGSLVVIVVANIAERRRALRALAYLLLFVYNVLFVALFGLAPRDADSTSLAVACMVGAIGTILIFPAIRQRLALLFPKPDPLTGNGGFDPNSLVHAVALILAVQYIGQNLLIYMLAGGLAGLAQAESNHAPTLSELLQNIAIFTGIAVLGIGFLIRRNLVAVLRRLGFRAPTLTEIGIGVGMAFALLAAAFFIQVIWVQLVPQDVFDSQTQVSRAQTETIQSMFLAFVLAFSAAFGEEMLFRGALQPIFGLWPTAIFFALSHIQYTFTPATLVIVVVGIGLGWLRQRFNTTTSMVAHFVYDFLPLFLLLVSRLPTS